MFPKLAPIGRTWCALLLALNPLAAAGANLPEHDCVMTPYEVVEVSSPVPGVIASILVSRSEVVRVGQPLIELRSKVQRAEVEIARARAAMRGELRLREASAAYSARKKRRTDELHRRKVASGQLRDDNDAEATLSLWQLHQAKDNRALAGLELERATELLKQRTITSPINGVVVDRFKSVGEFLENEPALRLVQLDPLRVEVIVPVEFFGQIQPGMSGQVTPEVTSQTARNATVTLVDRVVDTASGTFGVTLELPNPDFALPGGLRCRIRFQTTDVAARPAPSPPTPPPTAKPEPAEREKKPEAAPSPKPTPSVTAGRVAASDQRNPKQARAPDPPIDPPGLRLVNRALKTPTESAPLVGLIRTELPAKLLDIPAPLATVATVTSAPAPAVQSGDAPGLSNTPALCHRVGPFRDRASAEQFASNVPGPATVKLLTQVNRKSGKQPRYLIVSPKPLSAPVAKRQMRRLRKLGHRDVALMNGGAKRRLSYGLYRSKPFALERVARLERFGIEATIEQRGGSNQTWADLRIPAPAAPSVLAGLRSTRRGISFREVDCSTQLADAS